MSKRKRMNRPQLIRVADTYTPRVGESEIVCGRCGSGWLFVAKNRRRYLNDHGWSNTRKHGWVCPKCPTQAEERAGRLTSGGG